MKNSKLRSGLMATTTFFGAVLSTVAIPALVATVAMLAPTMASAQDLTSGTLSGTVKTDDGKASAGATVVIVGTTTSTTATATTDSRGNFRISQIPVGSYNVEITAADGSKTSSTVTVTLGTVSSFEFSAGSGTTVVVKGKARRNLDFDKTTTGQVVDVQAVADRIPLGRSIEAIADLVPGISVNDVFGPPSIGGASPAENIYFINGMNVTNFRNFLGGTTIPFDFYDQVEVKTGGYQAEFGRSTGGAIISTSRSGTNKFKGGFSYITEISSLSEATPIYPLDLNSAVKTYKRDFTDNANTESNLWLSGPLWKDHVYFFAFYNPRSFSYTSTEYQNNAVSQEVITSKEDPFYGAKLDFVLNANHRLEYTYFMDDQTEVTTYKTGNDIDNVNDATGGLTRIAKYTGKMTDWFTLSVLYGRSSFNQTISSDLDGVKAVFENGGIVRGNPALVIDVGKDLRQNLRVDGDFYFNAKGKHHVRVGWDQEKLNADAVSQYSGGIYYRYYGPNTNCGSSGTITNSCVRVRRLFSGGNFDILNEAMYIQDSWTVNDRLTLNIGLRNDNFTNYNADGKAFLETKNQLAPRLGLSYDFFGDKTTQLTAFYGRYYLPIAGNTNIRLAGGEDFTQDFYTYTSRDATTLVPVLGTLLKAEVLSNGSIPDADTLVSNNIEPQFQDEYILGIAKRLDNGWNLSASYMYRKLGAVMEDADVDYTPACAYLVSSGKLASANDCGSFGGSGYVLINPGSDLVIKLGDSWGALTGQTVTIPGANLDLPKAERDYEAFTVAFSRPWDGDWTLGGSLVISKSIGNIEGGVKSDNGQDDTGLTQDFDEPGWTDGSYGLLPNHHAFSFKLQGAKQITNNFKAGFSAAMLSPRKYGCIGYYPFADGRASQTALTSWYCNGKLTPRGKSFSGDWINKLDVSAQYKIDVPVGKLALTADIFNIFNIQGVDQYDEFGETGGVGGASASYKMPSSYQTPRYVRVSLNYSF